MAAHLPDSFTLFADGQAIAQRLIETCGEFEHLARARVPVLLSQRALVERGKASPVVCLHGSCVEGFNAPTRLINAFLRAQFVRPLCDGHDADFLIVVDVATWPKDAKAREHLLYHALSHIEQRQDSYGAPKWDEQGRPMLRMRAHDIERFTLELDRYGDVIEDVEVEAHAYARAQAKSRKLRIA